MDLPAVDFTARPGASKNWYRKVTALNRRAREQDVRIYFLGDSLTEFWQAQGKAVWQLDFAPLGAGNFGIAADRIENILWRLEHGNLGTLQPELFVLLAGTNNLAAAKPDSPQRVQQGIAQTIEIIQQHSSTTTVLLLSIPPSGYAADSALRDRIVATNHLLADWCKSRKQVTFVDVYPSFLQDSDKWRPGLTLDGTHFSNRGYDVLANTLRPLISAHFETTGTLPASSTPQ